jgi:molecular chaperone GrpE
MDEPTQQESAGADSSPSQADDTLALLKTCEKQRDEYLNNWKRAAADFINYKKDEAKRFSEFASFAGEDLVKQLLPILDSFNLALLSVDKNTPAYQGMTMIQGQLLEVLKRKGVEKISVARGDVFNPSMHEAMLEVELPDNEPEREKLVGKIVEELSAGYRMSGRVIRAAKVKLAK